MLATKYLSYAQCDTREQMIDEVLSNMGLRFDRISRLVISDPAHLATSLNSAHGLALGALSAVVTQTINTEILCILERTRFSQIIFCRVMMDHIEAGALARISGAEDFSPQPPDDKTFHSELRRIIQKYGLWKFFN